MAEMPNEAEAFRQKIIAFDEVASYLTGEDGYNSKATNVQLLVPRIASYIQEFWKLPNYAILLRGAGGPINPVDEDFRMINSRFNVWFFGPGRTDGEQEENAQKLWRIFHPFLHDRDQGGESFIATNGCRVYTVTLETRPFPYVDTDTGWRVVIAPYILTWGMDSAI